MIFSLYFQNSGDALPFEVVHNCDLFKFFVETANEQGENEFYFARTDRVNELTTVIHESIQYLNPLLDKLIGKTFELGVDVESYLDQSYLNRIHAEWVKSQDYIINIDTLRNSQDTEISAIGQQLHNMYPDNIRTIRIAEALTKLDCLRKYEDINDYIHHLEHLFSNDYLILNAKGKWNIFNNPYADSMTTNNDVTNFNFGYTYLGRQYYDKWNHFDTNLDYDDNYNYQTLEFSFNLNVERPKTIPFSIEFVQWCKEHNVKPVGNQIPIANLVDIENNLLNYRRIIYRNLRDRNSATIIIKE